MTPYSAPNPNQALFEREGLEPPTTQIHGTEIDIQAQGIKLRPTKWRMEGNQLLGETDYGTVCQFLPTNIICTGTDANGLPILKQI